jgi:hypothetical protein
MSKEVKVVQSEQVPTVPETRNVFECTGDAMTKSNGIIGSLLKFSKGDWLVGRDEEEIEDGTKFVAVVSAIVHGWVRWENNKPAEQIMGPLAEGFVPPARSTLGHNDESKWETDRSGGKPRDPWQMTIYLPMVSLDGESVYTFSTGTDGGKRYAIGPLCQEYGSHVRQHPDELPVVKLHQDSYAHSDRSIGRVKVPELPAVHWVKADKYVAALAAAAGQSLKLLENTTG